MCSLSELKHAVTESTDSLYAFLGQHYFSIHNFPLGGDIADHHH